MAISQECMLLQSELVTTSSCCWLASLVASLVTSLVTSLVASLVASHSFVTNPTAPLAHLITSVFNTAGPSFPLCSAQMMPFHFPPLTLRCIILHRTATLQSLRHCSKPWVLSKTYWSLSRPCSKKFFKLLMQFRNRLALALWSFWTLLGVRMLERAVVAAAPSEEGAKGLVVVRIMVGH